jgi:hypothetical protein
VIGTADTSRYEEIHAVHSVLRVANPPSHGSLRLIHSMRLLAQGTKIDSVALEAGYSSASAFILMFRECGELRPGSTSNKFSLTTPAPEVIQATKDSPPGSSPIAKS